MSQEIFIKLRPPIVTIGDGRHIRHQSRAGTDVFQSALLDRVISPYGMQLVTAIARARLRDCAYTTALHNVLSQLPHELGFLASYLLVYIYCFVHRRCVPLLHLTTEIFDICLQMMILGVQSDLPKWIWVVA